MNGKPLKPFQTTTKIIRDSLENSPLVYQRIWRQLFYRLGTDEIISSMNKTMAIRIRYFRTFVIPIVRNTNGRNLLVVFGSHRVRTYNIMNGISMICVFELIRLLFKCFPTVCIHIFLL